MTFWILVEERSRSKVRSSKWQCGDSICKTLIKGNEDEEGLENEGK